MIPVLIFIAVWFFIIVVSFKLFIYACRQVARAISSGIEDGRRRELHRVTMLNRR